MSSGTISSSTGDLTTAAKFLPPFTAVRGHKNVLALLDSLKDLAERCGQSGVMDDLPFFLSVCRLVGKVPHVLLLRNSAAQLQAAVLLYEYGIGPISSGVFIPADMHGERSVLAPEPIRSAVAWHAAESLLDHGAHLVYLQVRNADFSSFRQSRPRTFAIRHHIAFRILPIASTFEATIAVMGSHTRRNLRHYRRLVESKLGATFVPDVNLSESEFLALNRNSAYPAYPWVAKWRLRNARGGPDGLFAGLRAADGSWLSLVGGRHRNGVTYLDWQMNVQAYPALSIGTAMRAHLIEHEVARGTRQLSLEGGTPHSMVSAFLPENMCDLLLARPSLSPNILRKVAASKRLKRMVLAAMILDPALVWYDSGSQAAPSTQR
jgi:hypothetical protein